MNSFYADKASTQVRYLLPNFDLAFPRMNPDRQGWDKDECKKHIESELQKPETPRVIEAQSFNTSIIQGRYGDRLIPLAGSDRTCPSIWIEEGSSEGIDVCGVEQREYISLGTSLQTLAKSNRVVRVHMGETIIPEDGRDHIDMLLKECEEYYTASMPCKPFRIGHATHASIEAMNIMAKKGYFVEACLSSNKKTAVLDKRSDYPLSLMLLLGVKMVIGTDGGKLYGTSLPLEYSHAVKSIRKFLEKMQSSDEIVTIPSGQPLQYRHIAHLVKESCSENDDITITTKIS
jgi:hypothetical protein